MVSTGTPQIVSIAALHPHLTSAASRRQRELKMLDLSGIPSCGFLKQNGICLWDVLRDVVQ